MKRKGLLVLMLLFLTGCQEIYSVEDRAIVQILGYDYVDDKEVKGTVGIPHYGEEEKRTVEELNLTVTAQSIKEFTDKIEKESSKPISIGKLTVSLYDRELAENGLDEFLDVLSRDPRIGRNIHLGIVDGEVQEMIEAKYNQNETTARYVNSIIKNNSRRNFPRSNLHWFLYAYYAEGLDGYLPLLKKQNSHIKVTGIALFDKGTFVSTVEEDKVLILKLLKEKVEKGTASLPTEEKTGIEISDSNVKYRINTKGEVPEFNISLTITGFINEIQESSLDKEQTPELANKLEKDFAEYFKENSEELIAQFQENNTDPLGLGNLLKNRRQGFDKEKWEEQYPDVPVNVDVDVKITGIGISL
ncbi:Ger(x)C family spore germination protein [Halobacillus sp. Marseille-P3879]|uniref:Ger(x)C family spore germination protein n=1 Tax=Halobacillus sp. Marseille-P3879 TaxID=2045014 RepID=UPI000C7B52CD|nr:Ger(x)C family spore germination protein [Halobacillus sp. Marseille-P3879]